MSIETAWVPVALSSSIEPGTSTGAVVDGAEIVVWRDAKGQRMSGKTAVRIAVCG